MRAARHAGLAKEKAGGGSRGARYHVRATQKRGSRAERAEAAQRDRPPSPAADERRTSMQAFWGDVLLHQDLEGGWRAPPSNSAPAADSSLAALRELWDEMCVPQHSRDAFLRSDGASTDESVCGEVRRLSNIYTLSMRVVTLLDHREACLAVLTDVMDRCPDSVLEAPPDSVRRENDMFVSSLTRCVQGLRRATVEFLEALKAWRGGLNTLRPFNHRGATYVAKVQLDLQALQSHRVAQRFLKPEVLKSPLLFCFSTNAGGGAATAKQRRLVAARDVLVYELALSTPAEEALVGVSHLMQCSAAELEEEATGSTAPAAAAATPPPQAVAGAEAEPCDEGECSEAGVSEAALSQARTANSVGSGALTDTPIDTDALFDEAEPSPGGGSSAQAPSPEARSVASPRQGRPRVCPAAVTDSQRELAARVIQMHFRRYSERARLCLRSKEDSVNEEEEVRKRAEVLRLKQEEVARAEAEAELARDQAARIVDATRLRAAWCVQRQWRTWWRVRRALGEAEEKRQDKRKVAAVQLIWQHWTAIRVRALHRDARLDAARRYRARRAVEAAACARYDAALSVLMRVGRGLASRRHLLAQHLLAVQNRIERRNSMVYRAAQGMLARIRVKAMRAEVAEQQLVTRERERRLCAVLRIQAHVRGALARREAERLRCCRKLDADGLLHRAALIVQRAFRVAVAHIAARRRRLERQAEEEGQRDFEIREAAAHRIIWWYRGRISSEDTRSRIGVRGANRREYVQKVGDRYRRVMNDPSIEMHILASVLDHSWSQVHMRESVRRPSMYEESVASDVGEVNVLDTLAQHAVPYTRNRRTLAAFLLGCGSSISKKDTVTLRDYLLGDGRVQVSGIAVPWLDLTLVTRHEEDVSHIVLNNFLCHPRDDLLQMLSFMYSGAPPPVTDKWTAVSVMTRVISDWGLNATIGYLSESEESGGTTLLDAVLSDLNMSSKEDLLNALRADPLLLLFSDRLAPDTAHAIGHVLPDNQDDLMTWSHEMGTLLMLSTLPQDNLEDMADTLQLPVLPDREKLEQLVARHTVTFKPDV